MSRIEQIIYNAPDVEIIETFYMDGSLKEKTVNGVKVNFPTPITVKFFTSVTIKERMTVTEFKKFKKKL